MPGGDGTGPRGMGPMTGRAAGYCAGYGAPGYASPLPGRGFGWGGGRGFGRGRGWGRRAAWGTPTAGYHPYAAFPPFAPQAQEERRVLEGEMTALEARLAEVKQRLEQLATQSAKDEKG